MGVLGPALLRLAKMLVASAAVTALVAIPIGLAAGASLSRSVSVAWYVGGAGMILSGFLVGNRGPARPVDGAGWMPFAFRSRMLRWATKEEQEESINFSAVLIVIGFALLLLGIVADKRYRLV